MSSGSKCSYPVTSALFQAAFHTSNARATSPDRGMILVNFWYGLRSSALGSADMQRRPSSLGRVSHPKQRGDKRKYASQKDGPISPQGESRNHGIEEEDERPEQSSGSIFSGANAIENHEHRTDADDNPHRSLIRRH